MTTQNPPSDSNPPVESAKPRRKRGILKWLVLIVLAVLVIGLLVVYLNLNHIIRSTVETQATSSLNLATTLGSADLSLFGGSLSLNDLAVASPQGFSAPRMFTLGKAAVGVSFGQLRSEPIHIASIDIERPGLVIEQAGGKLNLQALMNQQSKAPEPTSPQEPTQPVKLIIDTLTIGDTQVIVRPGIPGLAAEFQVPIPSITLSNVGNGEGAQNGAAIKDVLMQVVTAMADKVSDSDKLPPEVRQLMKLNVGQLKSQLTGLVTGELNKVTGDLGKNLPGNLGSALGGNSTTQDTSKPAQDVLGGLLDKGKKKKK